MTNEAEPKMSWESEVEPSRRKRRTEGRFVLARPWRWVIAVLSVLSIIGILGLFVIIIWRIIYPAGPVVLSPEPTEATVGVMPASTATDVLTPAEVILPSSTPTSTATPRSTPTATPRSPTPTPTLPTEIVVGGYVKVSGTEDLGLNLREAPGQDYKIRKIAEEGSVLEVLDGPREADGYTWWQLKDETGELGWGAADYLEPTLPEG